MARAECFSAEVGIIGSPCGAHLGRSAYDADKARHREFWLAGLKGSGFVRKRRCDARSAWPITTTTLEPLRLYAAAGEIGARLYDYLIGRSAVVHGIGTIITWNTSHMRALFPALRVVTPEEAAS